MRESCSIPNAFSRTRSRSALVGALVEDGWNRKYLLGGHLEVAMLNEVLDLLNPLGKARTSHLKKATLGAPVAAGGLLHVSVFAINGIQRSVGVRVDSADEVDVDLDLVKLISVVLVFVAAELFLQLV